LLFYSFFQALLVILLCRKSSNPSLFIFFYVIVFYLNFHFNILRAGTATLIFLLALESKSLPKVFLLFLVGLTFHISIIVGFPILLCGRRLRKKHILLLSVFSILMASAITYILWDRLISKISGYLIYIISDGSSYPVVLLFTILVYSATIIIRKGKLPSSYIVSGLALIASLLFNFFYPGFYRITLIFFVVYFWCMIQNFKTPFGAYAITFYLFFFYHSTAALFGVYTERDRLERRVFSSSPGLSNNITREVLKTAYIPYTFYWNDF
jgi:hypothetical protein